MSVAIQTNCWRRDWRLVLSADRLRQLVECNAYPFAERTVLINELASYAGAFRLADAAIASGLLTSRVVVEQHAAAAIAEAGLSNDDLADARGYSIAELVGLHTTRCEYLLYFMSDCLPMTTRNWIPSALRLMESDPRIKVANLLWNGNTDEARAESLEETEEFFIGPGFSDQCFLVRVADFRGHVYSHEHPASARYPDYVQAGFERRVDSWMRHNRYLRATYKHASYRHLNLPPTLGQRIKRRLRHTMSLGRR
jgi:hypothetical protein